MSSQEQEHIDPRNDAQTDDRDALERARYLSRVHPDLRADVAIAVAYRELGYTTSGIASRDPIDVSEGTIRNWLDQVAVRYGLQAVETKWGEQRQGPLGTPTTEDLIDELSIGVLGDYLDLAQQYPNEVPEDVEPVALEEHIEEYLRGVHPADVPAHVDLDALGGLLGGWFQ